MKRFIVFICLLLVCNLLSAYTVKELYRKINNYENRYLYLYEAYDKESNDFIFYELETNETKKGVRTVYKLRSLDVDKLKKFVVYLQKNYDNKKYSEAIKDYLETNEDLVFLWDDVKLDPSYVLEEFCYELK